MDKLHLNEAYKARCNDPMVFEVTGAWRMGQHKVNSPKSRTVCITVATAFDASSILRNRKFLKGSGISMLDYLSREEFEQQKLLSPQFKEARERVRNGSDEVIRFRRGALYINGSRIYADKA